MSENNERRRRPPKKTNYKPLIAALSVILVVLGVVAMSMNLSSCAPQQPANTTLSSTTTLPTTVLPTTVPPTTIPPVVKTGTATIAATGDILMHKPCINPGKQADGSYDFAPYFAHVQDYVGRADYAVANLETTLAGLDGGYKYSGYPNFNCPDGIVSSLKAAGFDMLLTANNHTYDTQTLGFFRTQQVIAENGMDHIGTKPDAESDSYLIKEINGIRIGMINYTYETNSHPDKVDLNGGADLKENEKGLINVFLKDDVEGFSKDLEKNIAGFASPVPQSRDLWSH